MYDHLNNYNLAFILAGIPPIIGALFMSFIYKLKSDTITERRSPALIGEYYYNIFVRKRSLVRYQTQSELVKLTLMYYSTNNLHAFKMLHIFKFVTK